MGRRSEPTDPPTRRTGRAGLALSAVVALVMATPAAAQPAGEARSIDTACRGETQTVDRFTDIDGSGPHDGAIRCLTAYNIVQGYHPGTGTGAEYRPSQDVTRQQMATFVANALRTVPDASYALPDGGEPGFTDTQDISRAHRTNVAALENAGIVSGYGDGTFRPRRAIDRAQVASLVARSIEQVTGEELPRGDGFDDVAGVHQQNVEKLQAIGVVQGRSDGTYGPARATTRAQMASLVARSLAYLIDVGSYVPMAYQEPTGTGVMFVTDAQVGAHDTFDRATFTLEGDDGQVGWQVNYTDDPRAHGSGHPVDVAGEAVLEVVITGVTYSDEPADTWNDTITFGGDGIVEVESIGTYEGRHQVFVGTTGLNWFEADRLGSPERFYLDVSHGG